MRPVVKPELPQNLFPVDVGAMLLQTLGEYCSFSEQPLPAEHYVWNKRTGAILDGSVAYEDWMDSLLLSEACFWAQADRIRPELLFPDEKPLTFLFADSSPFRYELTTIRLIVIGEGGKVQYGSEQQAVLVNGTTDKARATIDFFALNTPWYDTGQKAVVIPETLLLAGEARLLEQRAEVYRAALQMADALDQANDRTALLAQGRRMMAAAGFWSTWATAFRNHGKFNLQELHELLLPAQGARWERGPGGHQPFLGTNPNALSAARGGLTDGPALVL